MDPRTTIFLQVPEMSHGCCSTPCWQEMVLLLQIYERAASDGLLAPPPWWRLGLSRLGQSRGRLCCCPLSPKWIREPFLLLMSPSGSALIWVFVLQRPALRAPAEWEVFHFITNTWFISLYLLHMSWRAPSYSRYWTCGLW